MRNSKVPASGGAASADSAFDSGRGWVEAWGGGIGAAGAAGCSTQPPVTLFPAAAPPTARPDDPFDPMPSMAARLPAAASGSAHCDVGFSQFDSGRGTAAVSFDAVVPARIPDQPTPAAQLQPLTTDPFVSAAIPAASEGLLGDFFITKTAQPFEQPRPQPPQQAATSPSFQQAAHAARAMDAFAAMSVAAPPQPQQQAKSPAAFDEFKMF